MLTVLDNDNFKQTEHWASIRRVNLCTCAANKIAPMGRFVCVPTWAKCYGFTSFNYSALKKFTVKSQQAEMSPKAVTYSYTEGSLDGLHVLTNIGVEWPFHSEMEWELVLFSCFAARRLFLLKPNLKPAKTTWLSLSKFAKLIICFRLSLIQAVRLIQSRRGKGKTN